LIEDQLTENERSVMIVLGLLAPKFGIYTDLGFYLRDDKIYIRSNGIYDLIKSIKLIQKIKLVPVEGNLAELKIKQNEVD